MYIVFIVLGVLFILPGLFMVVMFTGTTQLLGLALVGASCFLGILARIDQASRQHKALAKLLAEQASQHVSSAPVQARPTQRRPTVAQ